MSNEKAPLYFHEESFRAGWEAAFKRDSLPPGAHRCDCFDCREKESALYAKSLKRRKRKIDAENQAAEDWQIRARIYSEKDYWQTRVEALANVYGAITDREEKIKAGIALDQAREKLQSCLSQSGANEPGIPQIHSPDPGR
jgi:hypothetical protein